MRYDPYDDDGYFAAQEAWEEREKKRAELRRLDHPNPLDPDHIDDEDDAE